MNESDHLFDISAEVEEAIIAQTTSAIVEDFLLSGRDIPEGFMSIPPTSIDYPLKPGNKTQGEAIGAVRYAYRTVREDNIPKKISDTIQQVREQITPHISHIPLTITTYKRIFAQVATRLIFAPVHTRHEDGRITDVSLGFENLETQDFQHGRLAGGKEHAFTTSLEKMLEDEEKLCHERFELLEQFFQATTSLARGDCMAHIKQCGLRIHAVRKKMRDSGGVQLQDPNSFFRDEAILKEELNLDDTSPLILTWRAFQPSPAEEDLMIFLPIDAIQVESYLFYFDVLVESEGAATSEQGSSISARILERKLLIYYFASIGDKNSTDLRNMSYLKNEIQLCKRKINEESFSENVSECLYDVSFVDNHIGRINLLIQYSQQNFPGLVPMLQHIHQILVRFVSCVQTVLDDPDLIEDKKKKSIRRYNFLLFGKLKDFLKNFPPSDPVTNEIREICISIKEHLSHKEIDS